MGTLLLDEQVANIHINELLREAEHERLVNLARGSNTTSRHSLWRRLGDFVVALATWQAATTRVAAASGITANGRPSAPKHAPLTDDKACCA